HRGKAMVNIRADDWESRLRSADKEFNSGNFAGAHKAYMDLLVVIDKSQPSAEEAILSVVLEHRVGVCELPSYGWDEAKAFDRLDKAMEAARATANTETATSYVERVNSQSDRYRGEL